MSVLYYLAMKFSTRTKIQKCKYLNWSLFLNVEKVGTSRIFKSRVFQVLIVDGKNEFWYDDSLFAG
jgi:hypothetical protein